MCGDNMCAKGLEALLAVNGIELSSAYEALYEALRLQCFAQICDALKENKYEYTQALHLYRQQKNHAIFAEEMVRKYCPYRLEQDSYEVLGELFKAFFRRDGVRITYPDSLRRKLAFQQNYRCPMCGKEISHMAHLDHIIPWTYVGDMLENNLQLLCGDCNIKKNASVIYPLQVLLQRGNMMESVPHSA